MNKTSIESYFLFVKYISNITDAPIIKSKLSKLPTPRYKRIAKTVAERETIKPLLVFTKSRENVNKSAKKRSPKNISSAPPCVGSTKKIIIAKKPHRARVIIRDGKKFLFLFLFSSLTF